MIVRVERELIILWIFGCSNYSKLYCTNTILFLKQIKKSEQNIKLLTVSLMTPTVTLKFPRIAIIEDSTSRIVQKTRTIWQVLRVLATAPSHRLERSLWCLLINCNSKARSGRCAQAMLIENSARAGGPLNYISLCRVIGRRFWNSFRGLFQFHRKR